jgi:tetratricopeptide (TPR) repeat protein
MADPKQSKAYKDYEHARKVDEVISAREFYENKLAKDPAMPRYNHLLASMKAAGGDNEGATRNYRNAMAADGNNIMLRNDTALHYSKIGRQQDAIDEMRKGLLYHPKHGTLHKNLSAIYARTGQYESARNHAQEALYTNPDDAMNHRNIAQVHEMLGDTRQALIHNVMSIKMESNNTAIKPATTAYRAAARQTIIRGGTISDGVALLSAARRIEGKTYKSDTTQRTYEILMGIAKRRGNQAYELAKKEAELADQKAHMDAVRGGDVSSLLPNAHAIQRGPVRPLPAGRKPKKKTKEELEAEEAEREMTEDTDQGSESKRKKKHKKEKDHK